MARDQVPKSVKREVRKLIKALESGKIRVERVNLFGSYAKGEQRGYSDIDVAIVSPDFTGVRFEDSRRLLKVKLLLNSRIETHPYTPEDFADSPFVRDEILEYGIEIV